MTESICLPHPFQVVLLHLSPENGEAERESSAKRELSRTTSKKRISCFALLFMVLTLDSKA